MQLELMRRHGAERAVVFWGRNSDNESIAESARRHPDRFIAFASISPERAAYRQLWDRDDPGVLQTLDALLASGRFRGIGEISAVHFPSPGLPEADYDPSGPIMSGILALARRYRVPVLLHIEWTPDARALGAARAVSRRRRDLGARRLHAALHRPAHARAASEPDLRAERADLGPSIRARPTTRSCATAGASGPSGWR